MSVEITPRWDPTGTVSVTLDEERGELSVSGPGEEVRFVLSEASPDRLGWHERSAPRSARRKRRVSVATVLCHCLGEWEAEQGVIALSRRAAARAAGRGGRWREAARRLRTQCREGRGRRVSALPFQVWWVYLSDPARGEEERLTEVTAALRAGFRMSDGRPDTSRLLRRLGLVETQEADGRRERNRTVRRDTGLALCRALDRDPVELGL